MAQTITREYARSVLPNRPKDGHKGTFGHVFIIGGSRGLTGAVKLACEAAARSGVGLVTAGVPAPLGDIIAASLLECMSLLLPATAAETLACSPQALARALDFAAAKQAAVLGPGISQHAETRQFVLEFVRQCPVPLLVDADGLNCLSADLSPLEEAAAPRLLTPHPGEMARLMHCATEEVQRDREGAAATFARDHRCVVVLKGAGTVVADAAGAVFVNPTANSGLATGGTGDVLSGLIGGLLAQRIAPVDAAVLGVYVHRLAGDIASEAMTERGMIARDVIAAIPQAWRIIECGD